MPDDKDKQSGRKRTHAVVDRIEDGQVAVLRVGEDESMQVELPASLLPEGAEGGSHLIISVALDEDSRRAAEERVRALHERLEGRGGSARQQNFKL